MRIINWVFVLALVSVVLLAGCGAPAPAATEAPASVETSAPAATEAPASGETSEPVNPEPTAAPALTEIPTPAVVQPAPQPALHETRRLTLEFPPKIRAGDSDVVRLTLEVDALGNITPTAEIAGNEVTGEVLEIPDLYDTHQVIAETRFDIAGVEVQPTGLASEQLTPGKSVTFYWSIRPQEVGTYRGTVWFYLRFVDKVSGEESRETVSAQIIDIEAANLFGMSGSFARTTGLVGSVVGTIIGIPFFEDIVKLLFGRKKTKK